MPQPENLPELPPQANPPTEQEKKDQATQRWNSFHQMDIEHGERMITIQVPGFYCFINLLHAIMLGNP